MVPDLAFTEIALVALMATAWAGLIARRLPVARFIAWASVAILALGVLAGAVGVMSHDGSNVLAGRRMTLVGELLMLLLCVGFTPIAVARGPQPDPDAEA